MFIFKEKFHDYIFMDAKGNEYPAVVEFAPFQRIGKGSRKLDRKCGTFETSEHFLNFCSSMDAEEALPKLELQNDFDAKQEKQIRMTPLLEFINDKKSRRKDKDRKQEKKASGDKKILAPIREDTKEQRGKGAKPEAGEKVPKERTEKEKARRAERDKLRRDKRNLQNEEKKKERQASKKVPKESVTGLILEATQESLPDQPAKRQDPKKIPLTNAAEEGTSRRTSKGGERRPENRNKKMSLDSKAGNKENPKRTNVVDGERKTTDQEHAAGTENKDAPKKKTESRRYSERRIRNKDRPAIQIYQPGKVRRPDDGTEESGPAC